MMMEDVFTKVVTLLSQMVDIFLAQVMNYLLVLENFYSKQKSKVHSLVLQNIILGFHDNAGNVLLNVIFPHEPIKKG